MLHHPERLANVHVELVALAYDLGQTDEIIVLQGARSLADEVAAIQAGHSQLTDPKHSKHVIVPGYRERAEAVDLARFPVNWADLDSFKSLGTLAKDRAQQLGIQITWGGDFISLHDYDHFERAP